ncbi:hypothetical protein [Bacteroides fluxus]|jgi:hypothetical protein
MRRKRDRSESRHTRARINRWVRFLSTDGDWDYGFLLEMERMKLRQMEEYFKGRNTFVGIEYVQRDLRICLRLLDIVQEKDDLNIELSPLKFVPFRDKEGRKLYKAEGASELISYRKLYVNTRNTNRFTKFDFANPKLDEIQDMMYKENLRKEKAWSLYNLIRTYRMFAWWD